MDFEFSKPRTIDTVWLRIIEVGSTGKTWIFNVNAKEGGSNLGQIRWFGRWRKYSFFPNAETVFERQCLRDIAQVLGVLMEERKNIP